MSLLILIHISLCAAPTAPPLAFSIEEITDVAVTISWQAPELIHQNGEITHYVITYQASGSPNQMQELVMSIPGSDQPSDFTYNHMLQSLANGTEYSVQVAAATTNGTGPSASLSFSTTGWYSFTFHSICPCTFTDQQILVIAVYICRCVILGVV